MLRTPRQPVPTAGAVKVTAYDRLSTKALAPGSCDVLVLGDGAAGVGLEGVPLDKLPAVVLAALSGGDAAAAAGPDAQGSGDVADTVLVVCCHVARDNRCGHIGPPLADKLAELAGAKAPAGGVRVLKSSHIGGHKASCALAQLACCWGGMVQLLGCCMRVPLPRVAGAPALALCDAHPHPSPLLCPMQYAGNAIVYRRQDGKFEGNWFGGLNPGNADEFLTALFACKVRALGSCASWALVQLHERQRR